MYKIINKRGFDLIDEWSKGKPSSARNIVNNAL